MDNRDPNSESFQFPSCPGKTEIPTEKEQEALAAMKAIKERVRELKVRLKSGQEQNRSEFKGQSVVEMERELDDLRAKWATWEEKLRKAKKERMVFLGHEKE